MRKMILTFEAVLITILLISSSVFLNVSALQKGEKNHSDSYDIIIWRINKGKYVKEIKTVSNDLAMKIKAEFEEIENRNYSSMRKFEKKHEVLTELGVLSEIDSIKNYKNEFKNLIREEKRNSCIWLSLLQTIVKNRFSINSRLFRFAFSLYGFLAGSFHGPIHDQFILGIPFPMTAFAQIICSGEGPAYIFATWGLFIPMPFFTLCLADLDDSVVIDAKAGAGFASFLPFILNQNKEGEFIFGFFTIYGYALSSGPY